jgi:DNA-binding MarR family transcriptional regulator
MTTLEKSVGFLLNRAARSMKRGLEARLADYGITATQYVVLALLAKTDGLSQTQLGNRLSFDNPTITGVIDRMERDGLVERRRTSGDRRVFNIFLSDRARAILTDINSIAHEVNERALESYSSREKAVLISMLTTIWKNMNVDSRA